MDIIVPDAEGIRRACTILTEGGVVAHATETCYGLACDLRNREAVQALFAIKKRPEDMPVSALFSSIEDAKKYLEWNDIAEALAHEHLPGPLTLILKQRRDAPFLLHPSPLSDSMQPTVGLRISPHKTAATLSTQCAFPISTTSANIHGMDNPYAVQDMLDQYDGADMLPDVILDDGTLHGEEASTVINVSGGTIEVLRRGGLDI